MAFLRWLAQALCGRHDDVWCYEQNWLGVRCLKCGRISVGVPCETRVKVTR